MNSFLQIRWQTFDSIWFWHEACELYGSALTFLLQVNNTVPSRLIQTKPCVFMCVWFSPGHTEWPLTLPVYVHTVIWALAPPAADWQESSKPECCPLTLIGTNISTLFSFLSVNILHFLPHLRDVPLKRFCLNMTCCTAASSLFCYNPPLYFMIAVRWT